MIAGRRHGPRGGVDVAIIGGGIVGTSAAAFLAEAGATVALFEARGIAAGASGRNSGAIQDPFDPLLLPIHRDTLALYRELAASAPSFPLASQPAGLLLVDEVPERVAASAREAEAVRPDLRPTLLAPKELRELEPAFAPGLYACRLETAYPVPPAAATLAFAERAVRAGARIVADAGAELWVDGNDADGPAVRGVRTADTETPADVVLVAAGPWTPSIVDPPGGWRPIAPVWGVNVEVALEAPPRSVAEQVGVETIATEAPGGDAGVPSIFSLVTAAGSSSLGSTFLPEEPDAAAIAPLLHARGSRFVPAIAEAPIVSVRACARPQSADGRPLIGPIPWLEGVFVCAGHGPWGISLGPGSARLIADLILGRDAAIPPELGPDRFGTPAAR